VLAASHHHRYREMASAEAQDEAVVAPALGAEAAASAQVEAVVALALGAEAVASAQDEAAVAPA